VISLYREGMGLDEYFLLCKNIIIKLEDFVPCIELLQKATNDFQLLLAVVGF
jgi:hypothetical protein